MRVLVFVVGLVLLVVGATVAVIGTGQFLALQQHRLPGTGSVWSWLTYRHLDPEGFDPAVRRLVRRATWLMALGILAIVAAVLLLAMAQWLRPAGAA